MAEYISRDEVMQKFLNRGDGYITMLTMRDMINEIPAADVQPVKHGRWTRIDDEYGHDYVCSECNDKNDRKSHYCPNCGARMEQGG